MVAKLAGIIVIACIIFAGYHFYSVAANDALEKQVAADKAKAEAEKAKVSTVAYPEAMKKENERIRKSLENSTKSLQPTNISGKQKRPEFKFDR